MLSAFSFANIYAWKGLFEISWCLLQDSLCVFFKDKIGCFMYLPALGPKPSFPVVEKAFAIMDRVNTNREISRVENIEEEELSFYRGQGFVCREKDHEYLCLRSKLAGLSGNAFKSKRSSYNYFNQHYQYRVEEFKAKHKSVCLDLFAQWMSVRKAHSDEPVYRGMLEDSQNALEKIFSAYEELNLEGIIVEVEGEIKAFTFGCKLNKDTFCILYETADLSVKGLAQFIFREFCRRLSDFKYINIMDDSGLENLRKVKLSYHPQELIPGYIATR